VEVILTGANEILGVFRCIFRPFLVKLSTGDDHVNVLSVSFLKIVAVNAMLCLSA